MMMMMIIIIMTMIMPSQGRINPPLSVGQWCLVNFEGAIFCGAVTKSVGTETEINVMT